MVGLSSIFATFPPAVLSEAVNDQQYSLEPFGWGNRQW